MQNTSLYRFYDASEALLYIGITNSLTRRLNEHHEDKPWYLNVARVTVEHHPTRAAALRAEKSAIKAERPKYNVQHNQGAQGTVTHPDAGQWLIENRQSGHQHRCDLFLYPELDCSAMVDDVYELDGEGQFEEYVQYLERRYPQWLADDAVPIIWSVHSGHGGGIFEAAPFAPPSPPWGDFLTHFTWPADARTGEPLDWFQLPVLNDRFPDFARALAWTPSPLQANCPLRSLICSRQSRRPLARAPQPA